MPEWIILRNRRPKLGNLGYFKSINKNFQNLKFFEVGSLPNSTQGIFDIIQKKFCRSISAAPDDFRVQFCPFQVY